MNKPKGPEPLAPLAEFHRRVDREAQNLAEKNAGRLQCGAGCADCCRDDLSVHPVEAAIIEQHYPELLREAESHPPGACAFLDAQRRCRIYAHRPYICRTQGLPMRWFASPPDDRDEIVELRDICPLNLPGPALESITADDCWLLGPFEQELQELATAYGPADTHERIRLRDLFSKNSD